MNIYTHRGIERNSKNALDVRIAVGCQKYANDPTEQERGKLGTNIERKENQ